MRDLHPQHMTVIREISLVGWGLVAQTFYQHFKNNGLKIKQIVYKSTSPEVDAEIECIPNVKLLKPVDLVLVCVNDDALPEIIHQIHDLQLIAHTSGSVSSEQYGSPNNVAVFYPLQSFAHLRMEAVSEIPILLDAPMGEVYEILHCFAKTHFKVTYKINAQDRENLHLAAVFANNFTNHLIHLAQTMCAQNKLPFELLQPLIQETAHKWSNYPAAELQTGPAQRGDQTVIDRHLSRLPDELKAIYTLLSNSIINSSH